ncbi:hypothetical protein ACU4GG_04085 [Streptomyces nojiriensis]
MPYIRYKPYVLVVHFSTSETDSIADGTSVLSLAAGAVPDPIVSKIVAGMAGVVTLMARRASRKGGVLGVVQPLMLFYPMGMGMPFTHSWDGASGSTPSLGSAAEAFDRLPGRWKELHWPLAEGRPKPS